MATPFIIYESWSTLIANLPTEQAGVLIQALCARQLGQEREIADPTVNAIYLMIVEKMDEDQANYNKKAEQKREAASEAAKARWSRDRKTKAAVEKAQTDTDTCSSNEAPKESASDTVVMHPSIDEIRSFARDEGMSDFNADAFYNFYESKGWRVGGDVMTDWRSAARCWYARDQKKRGPAVRSSNQYCDMPKLNIDYDAIAASRHNKLFKLFPEVPEDNPGIVASV